MADSKPDTDLIPPAQDGAGGGAPLISEQMQAAQQGVEEAESRPQRHDAESDARLTDPASGASQDQEQAAENAMTVSDATQLHGMAASGTVDMGTTATIAAGGPPGAEGKDPDAVPAPHNQNQMIMGDGSLASRESLGMARHEAAAYTAAPADPSLAPNQPTPQAQPGMSPYMRGPSGPKGMN